MNERVDVFGNELFVGDTVAAKVPTYSNLIIGTIISFTPKGVWLEYTNPFNSKHKLNRAFNEVVKKVECVNPTA